MKIIKKNLKLITLILIIAIVITGAVLKYVLYSNVSDEIIIEEETSNEIFPLEEEQATIEIKPTVETIYVDIKGAVNKPGVYEVAENKKIIDIVELAGGLTAEADTSMINLAKKVHNEMVIIIYTQEEVKNAQKENTIIKIIDQECVCPEVNNDACLKNEDNDTSIDETTDESSPTKSRVNINTANIEELLTLSGIGEAKAQAIIKYREEVGKFTKIEDIINVPGIGENLYEKIKNDITV